MTIQRKVRSFRSYKLCRYSIDSYRVPYVREGSALCACAHWSNIGRYKTFPLLRSKALNNTFIVIVDLRTVEKEVEEKEKVIIKTLNEITLWVQYIAGLYYRNLHDYRNLYCLLKSSRNARRREILKVTRLRKIWKTLQRSFVRILLPTAAFFSRLILLKTFLLFTE